MDKFRIVFPVYFVIIFITSCTFLTKDDTWVAVLAGIPDEISPAKSHSLLVSYVLKQTHETLFKRDKNGNFYSNIIDNWQRSIDYRQFEFCLSNNKVIDKDASFTFSDFEALLSKIIIENKLESPHFRIKQKCIYLTFNKAQERLLDLLSLMRNAPSKSSNIKGIENGLGPFIITQIDSKSIQLKRKIHHASRFNTIHFLNINGLSDNLLNSERIIDFNFVHDDKIPSWVKVKYRSFNITTLKTRALFINIQDDKVRDIIFNCLDIQSFRSYVYGVNTPMIDIGSVLPVGIMGSISGKINQKCNSLDRVGSFGAGSPKSKFKLVLWNISNKKQLELLLDEFAIKTGIKISVEYHSYNELLNFIYKKRSNYNMIPLSIDTKVPTYDQYFESFGDSKRSPFSFIEPSVKDYYYQIISTSDSEQKKRLALKLQDIILSKHLVLPLYQIIQTFYYPKYLKNIHIGFDYLDFPDIGRIEI